jgi:uncharacterized membrane protein
MKSEPDTSKAAPPRTWLSACYSSVQWVLFAILALAFLLTLPIWLLLNYIFTLPASTLATLLIALVLSLYFGIQPWNRIEAEANPASYAFAVSTIGELGCWLCAAWIRGCLPFAKGELFFPSSFV